jgi:hypothetical protein
LDCRVSLVAEVNEVVVLGNDVSSRTREVEGISFLDTCIQKLCAAAIITSEIMEFKFEMSRKFLLIPPDYPTNTGIHKPVLMSGTMMRKWHEMGTYALILLTRGIWNPNLTLGVANGQKNAPDAPSTWIGTSSPVSFSYSSRSLDTSSTGS